jgi:ribonuclease HI
MLLTFGKYKNKSVDDIFKLDKQYIRWLIKQSWFEDQHIELFNYSKNVIDNFNPVINKEKFVVYTDGACPNNGSSKARSSIGIHFSEKNAIKIDDVGRPLILDSHSNNYAEMNAIYECLRIIKENNVNIPIELYTDSSYCRSILLEWYEKWLRNDLLKNKKNLTIIEKTYNIFKTIKNINIIHINSHTNKKDEHSYGNHIADQLARNALR